MTEEPKPKSPPPQNRSVIAIALCLVGVLGLAAADLASKDWAVEALSAAPISDPGPACVSDSEGRVSFQRARRPPLILIGSYLELRYAENCGAAFGLLRDAGPIVRLVVFGLAAVAASLALLWMFVRGRGGAFFGFAVPLIVSGALGNLYDRGRFGYVVDFIRFHVADKFEYPTFNVADIGITVGVALLFIDSMREGKRSALGRRPYVR